MESVPTSTLTELLEEIAKIFGTKTAIYVSEKFVITHARLNQLVSNAAGLLLDAGVGRGEVVALAFPNTVEFVIMFIAVIRVRAIAAPINNDCSTEKFEIYLSTYEPKLLLTDDNVAAQTAALNYNIPHATVLLTSQDSDITFTLTHPESGSNSENSVASLVNEPFDGALFIHTSRTTGVPKRVQMSQLELVSYVRKIKSRYRLTESDSTVIVLPLFEIDGLIDVLLSSLGAGASVTLPAVGSFSASIFWAEMKRSNATWFAAVHRIQRSILFHHISESEAEYPRLRFIRSCGVSLDSDVLNSLLKVFRVPVLKANPITDPLLEDGPGPHNPETNKSTSQSGWFLIRNDGFSDEDEDIKELFKRRGLRIYPIEAGAVNSLLSDVVQGLDSTVPDNIYGEESRFSRNGMGSRSSPSSTTASTSSISASALDRPESILLTVKKKVITLGINVDAANFIGLCKHFGFSVPDQANGNHAHLYYIPIWLLIIFSKVMNLSSNSKSSDLSALPAGASVLMIFLVTLWAQLSSLRVEYRVCLILTCLALVIQFAISKIRSTFSKILALIGSYSLLCLLMKSYS